MATKKQKFDGVVSALGTLLELVVKFSTALKKQGHSLAEALVRLAEDEKAQDEVVAILARLVQLPANCFRLVRKPGRTTDEVVSAGKYGWFYHWITNQHFPWIDWAEVAVIIELVPMPDGFTFDEALTALKERGLSRPTFEDGLLFGEQHPEEQRTAPVMFPHEPVSGGRGHPCVVYLYRFNTERNLNLNNTDDRWHSFVRVAGVRK